MAAFWDAVFAGSSALLAIFFGAALGNVVRGVPLDRAGDFFLPLWTDFPPVTEAGILDWYTVLVAIAALLTLTVHGALWLALKNRGALHARARALASHSLVGGTGRRDRDHPGQLPRPAAPAARVSTRARGPTRFR